MLVVDEINGVLGQDMANSLGELNEAVHDGLPKATLRSTARRLYPNAVDQTRFMFRVVPEATFKRRKDRLNGAESERTERLARTIAIAEHVLEDKEAARQFLINPHPLLNGKSPIDTAFTELGARQIEEMLLGVYFGLPV